MIPLYAPSVGGSMRTFTIIVSPILSLIGSGVSMVVPGELCAVSVKSVFPVFITGKLVSREITQPSSEESCSGSLDIVNAGVRISPVKAMRNVSLQEPDVYGSKTVLI